MVKEKRSKQSKKILKRKRKTSRSQVMKTLGRILSWAFLIIFVLTSVVVLVTPNRRKAVEQQEKAFLREKASPKEIGMFYVREGNFIEAKKYLYKAYQGSPDDPILLRYLIRASLEASDYNLLKNLLPKYISIINEKIAETKKELYTLQELYQREKSGDTHEKIVLTEGELSSYLSSLIEMKVLYATVLASTGELEKALEIAKELREAFPKNKRLANLEERLVFISGNPEKIISYIQSKPKSTWTKTSYYLLGSAYASVSKLKEAEKVYKEAISKYPTERIFTIGLIGVYRREGKYNEIIKLLQKTVGYTDDPRLLYYYGEALYKTGKKKEADLFFTKAIKTAKDELTKKLIELQIKELKSQKAQKQKGRKEEKEESNER